MINTNLKTQVQARIDAITGATTLSELLRIQTQANGLGCNITLLTSEIQTRLTALNGGTSLTDLTIASLLAEGKADRAYYQVPFAVSAGDKLFIDAFGQVRRRKTDYVATAAPTLFGTAFSPLTPSAIPAGAVLATSDYSTAAGAILLANGNRMILRAVRVTSPTGTQLRAVVLNPLGAVLSEQTSPEIDGAGGLLFSDQASLKIIAIREVNANVFRLYVTTAPNAGDGFNSQLAYVTLTYNNVTHAVTVAAGAAVLNRGSGVQWAAPLMTVSQTELYVPLRDSSNRLYILNTSTSTATQVTTLSNTVTSINNGVSGGLWGLAVSSGNRLLVKVDAAISQALPANLTADGCFAATHSVELLSGRLWVSISGAGLVKLVSFTADYAGCTIYTVGSVATSASVATILKHNDTYTVGLTSGSVFAFTGTGAAAPTDFQPDAGFRLTDRENFTSPFALTGVFRRVVHNDVMVCTGAAFNSSSSARLIVLQVSPCEYMAYGTQVFATCLTAAAANGFAEVQLSSNTVVSPDAASTYSTKAHQNLLTTLAVRGPLDQIYRATASTGASVDPAARYSDKVLSKLNRADRSVLWNNVSTALDPGFTYVLSPGRFTAMTPHRRVELADGSAPSEVSVIEVDTAAVIVNIGTSLSLLSQQVTE